MTDELVDECNECYVVVAVVADANDAVEMKWMDINSVVDYEDTKNLDKEPNAGCQLADKVRNAKQPKDMEPNEMQLDKVQPMNW